MQTTHQELGLVSVIIPGYKSEFIIEAIESALSQTYTNIEIIVVDDGSPNGLELLLEDYISSQKIEYIYQDNQKMAAARNNGIKHSKGQYIAFLDDDDLWEPQKIELQVTSFADSDVGLVYTFAEGFDKNGTVGISNFEIEKQGKIYNDIFLQDFIANSSVMIRKDCFEKLGLFNSSPDYFGVDDCDMWTRICYHYSAKCVTKKLTRIRLHEAQFSGDKTIMHENDLRIRMNLMEELNISNKYRNQYFARVYFNIGFDSRRSSKIKAAKFYLKSFKAIPSIKAITAIIKLPLN